jgi:hypothetical protein
LIHEPGFGSNLGEFAMQRRRVKLGSSAALVLLSLLSACGSSSSSSSSASASSSAQEKTDPYSEIFGLQSPAKMQAMQAKTQKRIAECMRKEGFSYVPYTPSQSQTFNGPQPGEELEWKRKNGYGMAASFATGGGAVQNQRNDDPNLAIQNSLSVGDQELYQKALYGAQSAPDDQGNMELSGCTITAFNGGADKELFQLRQQLSRNNDALSLRIEADPRVAKAAQQWSTCMRNKGNKGIRTEADIYEKVLNPMYNKIFESAAQPSADAPAASPKFDEKKIAEFRKVEFALAADDADCSAKTSKIRKTVTDEYRTAFLQQNRADLEKIQAAQDAP